MVSKIKRLDFAHIDCKASILVKDMSEQENITIGCFAYYLEYNGEKIMIDSGIENIATVNKTKSSKDDWKRSVCEYNICDNLSEIGIDPLEIDKVFLTHSHYDHISGICHFENAQIYMTKNEFEYLNLDINPHKKYLLDVIEFLKKKKNQGKLILVDDNYNTGNIRCVKTGGHTPGSMIIYIDDYLFTGDCVFLLDNIFKKRPIGFSNEPENAMNALKLCCEHKGTILTGHDFKCVV